MFENDNNDFGYYGENDGLDEWEIEERDNSLTNIRKDVTDFMSIANVDLPIRNIELALTPGIPHNVVYVDSNINFGISWIHGTVIPKIKSCILTAVKKKSLRSLEKEMFSSYILRGSPEAIAIKLIRKNVLGISYNQYFSQHHYYYDEDLETLSLETLRVTSIELTSNEIISAVKKEYEEKHMRYKLWSKKALSKLADYLFFDYEDERYDIELPIMSEYISGAPLSKEDLIAEAHEAIHMFCEADGTEISYPFFSENGYIFSEFLPLALAENSVQNKLYEWYLTACHNR